MRNDLVMSDHAGIFSVRLAIAICCLLTRSTRAVDWTSSPPVDHLNDTVDPSSPPPPLCRDRQQTLPPLTFRLTTCASCYFYLFMDDLSKELFPYGEWLVGSNDTRVLADIHDERSRSTVCSTLTPDECNRWKSCCESAEECCRVQLERLTTTAALHHPSVPATATGKPPFCPQQWDGFGCWDFTVPGKVASSFCPEFIKFAVPSEKSYKECTVNGTWYQHPESQLEWTDYSSCITFEDLKRSNIASIICNVISLIALIPSVIIFTCYRPLRIQNRVMLHINLFASFILYGIATLLWDTLIVLNRMEHDSSATYINQNTGGCKFLYVLTRYSRMANFLWMFCEAVFLHRLLVKAFQPPKNLIAFYIIGWVFPWIPVITYVVLRLIFADTSCWIEPFGYWEWLIYIPNLLALLLNFVVLLDILRILVTQVQSHANELNSYRRALKATFILVPLFGLQLFLVIYRPPYHSSFSHHYEMIAAFVVNLQGLFVALIFCLINGEVISHLKRSWQKFRAKIHRGDYPRTSTSITLTTHSELGSMTKDGGRRNSNGSSNRRQATNAKMAVLYERGYSNVESGERVSCLATDDLATNDDQVLQNGQETKTENGWRLGN